MSVDIGIIGLAKSGRTTIFNALTRGEGTGGHSREGSASHIGTVKVPEPRLATLAGMFQPDRVVPASVTYIDIGASVKGLVEDKGIGGQLLAQLGTTDVLINVVRAFEDESVPHTEGSLDIERDIANMNLELAFSDMALLERRLGRIEVSLKGAKQVERSGLLREQELVLKIRAALEKDMPVRELTLTPEEVKIMAGYQLLSAKPLLIVVNIGEEQIPEIESLEVELNSRYRQPRCRLAVVCGGLEMELAQCDEDTAEALYADFGMEESGVDRIVKFSYELLGLVSFFTIVSGEVKVWPVPAGTDAVTAAAKIHSDISRGFIRAEVINYNDLVECGSLAEARRKGLLRLEGKNYTVHEGDAITFLFNV